MRPEGDRTRQAATDQARAYRREQVGEIVTAAVCLGLWGFVWYLTEDFPERAQTYPQFVLACLFAFSTIHLLLATKRLVRPPSPQGPDRSAAPPGGEDEQAPPKLRTDRLLALVAGSIVYVALLPIIGFIVSTTTFLVLGVCLSIGWSVKRVVAIVALVGTLYFVVGVLLGIRLPSGFLI